jgi:hypothetical protein
VANSVEMLSGRRKRDYEAESLAAQASQESTASAEPASQGAGDQDDELAETSSEDEQVLVLA